MAVLAKVRIAEKARVVVSRREDVFSDGDEEADRFGSRATRFIVIRV
jgi:hypothetical protein